MGDELAKPHGKGGLDLGTIDSTPVIAMIVIALITFTLQRPKTEIAQGPR